MTSTSTDPGRDPARVTISVPMQSGTGHQPPATDMARREADQVAARIGARLEGSTCAVWDPDDQDDEQAQLAAERLPQLGLPTDAAWLVISGPVL